MKPVSIHDSIAAVWGDNCKAWSLHLSEGMQIKQESMPPGSSEKQHVHQSVTQFFYILKGTARIQVNDQTFALMKGMGLSIHPGLSHYISNPGIEDLEFLVCSNPPVGNDRIEL